MTQTILISRGNATWVGGQASGRRITAKSSRLSARISLDAAVTGSLSVSIPANDARSVEHQKAKRYIEAEAQRIFGLEIKVEFVDRWDEDRTPPAYIVARVAVKGGDVITLVDGEEALTAGFVEAFPGVDDDFVIVCYRQRA